MKQKSAQTTKLIIHVAGASPAWAAAIRRAARFTLERHAVCNGTLEIVLVGQAEMKRLHAHWMNDPTPTDVLTFDLRDRPTGRAAKSRVDAQIIVCKDVARREARRRGLPHREELLRYVVHGCLHLCGYDDTNQAVATRMTREQERIMALPGGQQSRSTARRIRRTRSGR